MSYTGKVLRELNLRFVFSEHLVVKEGSVCREIFRLSTDDGTHSTF